MEDDKIILDKETFKALAVDTRINILKLLLEKQYTGTEIAEKLNLSASTVKEHLDVLVASGLVKQEDTDRKWKYYSLTLKGKRVVQPRDMKVLVAFCLSTFAAAVSGITLAKKLLVTTAPEVTQMGLMMVDAGAEAASDMAEESAIAMKSAAPEMLMAAQEPIIETTSQLPYGWLIATILFIASSAFLLGIYLKKTRTIIVEKQVKP